MENKYYIGLKTLWEKEKVLVTSNFSFSRNVFHSYISSLRQNATLHGNGLKCQIIEIVDSETDNEEDDDESDDVIDDDIDDDEGADNLEDDDKDFSGSGEDTDSQNDVDDDIEGFKSKINGTIAGAEFT